MKRGAIVVVAAKGAYTGKPRPAVVVQSDLFNPTHASVTVCPITSDCVDAPLFRLTLPEGPRTGLKRISQVMVDKIVSVKIVRLTNPDKVFTFDPAMSVNRKVPGDKIDW